jgi:hypothetical protein
LRWAGVALVTLAAIFLVSTAISRGWIGPELQLLGATLGGIALLGGAWYLANDRPPWSLALGSGGAIVVAVCALATHEWLDLVGPGPAVALTALATAASTATAWQTRQQGTALVAGVVAAVAPVETLEKLGEYEALGWEVGLILLAAGLGLALRWPWLRLIVGWCGALVLIALAFESKPEGSLLAIGIAAIVVVASALWTGPILSAHRRGCAPDTAAAIDVRSVAAVPGWVWLVLVGLLDLTADGVAGLAGSVWLIPRAVPPVIALSTMLGGLAVIAVGLAIYLDGPALAVALLVQGLVSLAIGRKVDDLPLRLTGAVLVHLALVVAVVAMIRAFDGGYPNPAHALGTLAVVGAFAGAAALTYPTSTHRVDLDVPFVYPFVVAWSATMLWVVSVFANVSQGLTFVSAVWAIMAGGALVFGLQNRNDVIRITGLVTLAITLLKLFTVDLAEVDVLWRVGLFFVVGVGFIALGLRIPNLVRSDENPDGQDGQDGR